MAPGVAVAAVAHRDAVVVVFVVAALVVVADVVSETAVAVGLLWLPRLWPPWLHWFS